MSGHLSREVLLQLIDSELPQEHMGHAAEHLALCPQCQEQRGEIKRKLGELNGFYGAEAAKTREGEALSRIRLKEALAPSQRPSTGLGRYLPAGNLSRAAIASVLVFALSLVLRTGVSNPRESAPPVVDAGRVPNGILTPGAVHVVTLSQICSSTDDDLDPALPSETRNAVLREYGLRTGGSERTYQIDYLINPQLGGTDDIKNLWPQPSQEGAWNAQEKDVLEKHLHALVCERSVDLAVAQREIATDWIAAYRKYIDPRMPARV